MIREEVEEEEEDIFSVGFLPNLRVTACWTIMWEQLRGLLYLRIYYLWISWRRFSLYKIQTYFSNINQNLILYIEGLFTLKTYNE
jgi:hypothetical protein